MEAKWKQTVEIKSPRETKENNKLKTHNSFPLPISGKNATHTNNLKYCFPLCQEGICEEMQQTIKISQNIYADLLFLVQENRCFQMQYRHHLYSGIITRKERTGIKTL